MTFSLPFKTSNPLTIGVELELQLINLQNYNLAREANDFLRRLNEINHVAVIKPEITESMIEINSSIHTSYQTLKEELYNLRDTLVKEARKTHIGICGGGTHPFQKWKDQKIFHTERFEAVSEQYGYLAKQFTVFGQHIHVGCTNGDDALYLCHALAHYIPHFIVLSAASPFNQGVDTMFDCSRLGVISAFPLSGTPPWMFKWEDFEKYFEKLYNLKIITSIKDFYWDIRPKPEYGTIEIRICDTPLNMDMAATLAAYAQTLAAWLLDEKPFISRDVYITYLMNRFRAARFGFNAEFIDVMSQTTKSLSEDILITCDRIKKYAVMINSVKIIECIKQLALERNNGSLWLRKKYLQYKSLPNVVRSQVDLWECKSCDLSV
jgi:glutamate---cysteine ligase / carboxylate-amine ligase